MFRDVSYKFQVEGELSRYHHHHAKYSTAVAQRYTTAQRLGLITWAIEPTVASSSISESEVCGLDKEAHCHRTSFVARRVARTRRIGKWGDFCLIEDRNGSTLTFRGMESFCCMSRRVALLDWDGGELI